MVVLLSVAAIIAVPNASAHEAQSVPFELDKGRIFVGAFVNGKGPYRFGFDTGASGMGRADIRLVEEASLPRVDQAETSDSIATATVDVVSAKSVQLGSVEKHDVQLLSRDYNKGRKAGDPPLMGIIGRDFFADRLVTIDYPARKISFAAGELRPGAKDVTAYSGSFVIPVCFASGCYDGKIDTGSNRGLVVPKAIIGKVDASAPVLVGEVRRTNSVATLHEMTLNEAVRVGSLTATPQKVLYADPSDALINIGSDFLKDYVLTIDQRNRLLRISKPSG